MFSLKTFSKDSWHLALHEEIIFISQNTLAKYLRDFTAEANFAHSKKQVTAWTPTFRALNSILKNKNI